MAKKENLFNTDTNFASSFDQTALETELLGASLASVKEQNLESSSSHVSNIVNKEEEELKNKKMQELKKVLFQSKKDAFDTTKLKGQSFRIICGDGIKVMREIASLHPNFKLSVCLSNIIDKYVEDNREELEEIIKAIKTLRTND